jgi:DNA primase large subunit
MNLRTLSRYPFLPERSDYLKGLGIDLRSLVGSAAYEQARHAGRRRVMDALVNGDVGDAAPVGEADMLVEMLSYAVARMIVSCTADKQLIQRYALAEAVATERRLLSEDLGFVADMARLFGMDAEVAEDGEASVHFTDYLRHSSDMRSDEWKLSRQDMAGGRVPLTRQKLARLLRHAVMERIESELPLAVSDEIETAFRGAIDMVREEIASRKAQFERESYGRVSFLRLPPCMKELLAMVQRGQNVPHVGRFALTSFLHTIGLGPDEIVAVFATSPDFKEQLARYQVEHITGKSSGVEYLPPECATMKTQGICFKPDSLCKRKWMHHPLTYYRVKGKKRPAPEKEPTSESAE